MPEKTCQKILLKEEIKIKNKKIKQYSLELNNVKNQLESKISFFSISVTYVHTFQNNNKQKLSRPKSIQF